LNRGHDFVPQKTDEKLDLHQGSIFRGALILGK
jgi:hypothetical protein